MPKTIVHVEISPDWLACGEPAKARQRVQPMIQYASRVTCEACRKVYKLDE